MEFGPDAQITPGLLRVLELWLYEMNTPSDGDEKRYIITGGAILSKIMTSGSGIQGFPTTYRRIFWVLSYYVLNLSLVASVKCGGGRPFSSVYK